MRNFADNQYINHHVCPSLSYSDLCLSYVEILAPIHKTSKKESCYDRVNQGYYAVVLLGLSREGFRTVTNQFQMIEIPNIDFKTSTLY